MLIRMIPFVFVMLWASGFVGARFGLQYAEPATLLSIRMVANVVLFLLLIAVLKRSIPKGRALLHCLVVGILIHGFYLGGVFMAISLGMPAALSSLLVGIQPILTAVLLLTWGSEKFTLSQWLGLGLGFIGISLVLVGNIEWQSKQYQWLAISITLCSLFGMTLGTLYQKKFCQKVDMVGAAMLQYVAAAGLFIPYAFMFETRQVEWTSEFILTLLWLVVVLSCFAVLLLLYMVKNGAASSVASVFYLVPPTTALQAWLMFGESFDWLGGMGFVFASVAVYLVVKKPTLAWRRSKRAVVST
ncbi:DMT family transporter [Vibrio genomosp. F10]|uniref:DMT family transporter n=2 Tax=Vibrio genomosp. F10 TaxID=723171 RepID=UPI000474881F|nr:DMT family transporter [Vibrio genomosp. F10]OEF05385.1 multidrug transporter [Vibrio genomosp. F10 str. 9ZB36]